MSEKSVIINNSENIDSIEFKYNRTINIYSNNRKQCKSVSINSPNESFEVVINRPKYNEVEKCVINWLLSSVVIRVTSKLSNWKLMSILSNKDSRVLYVTKFESLGAKIISNVLSLK